MKQPAPSILAEQQSAIIEWVDPKLLKPHDFSLRIYGSDGYQDLIESIRELGVLQPLFASSKNIIFSGHRRWRAALDCGVQVPVIRKRYSSQLDEHRAIIELNRYRIKNGEQQFREGKALKEIEAQKAKNRQGTRADLQPNIRENFRRSSDSIAQAIGLGSGRQWDKLELIAEHKPELLPQIKPDGISIHRAFKLVQHELISKPTIIPKEPEGLFSVIVIDPPWPYQTTSKDYDPEGRVIAPPYEAMSIDDIMAIQPPMADDCIVWLWTTNAFMHEAHHVLEAWGLIPKVILTWFKGSHEGKIQRGVGHWLRGQTEHCIMAVKGKPKLIPYESVGTAFFGINRGHSKKPDEFFSLVESICPGRKLEWFARKKREGWEAYGDQLK